MRPARVTRNQEVLIRSGRCFGSAPVLSSGHNRWSKIKHDKFKSDAAKTKQRSTVAKEITQASREYGPNLATNSRLLAIVASAKKLGFPKASIDSAIARGQGISIDGSALESLTIEAMMPPAIAFIIECQTDSKARTLQDLRQVLKDFKASMTPTMYMFEKKGKIVFERNRDLEDDRILEEAIDAGAVDIEFGEDEIVVYADPTNTRVIAETLGSSLSMKAESSDVIWGPKEDARVTIDSSRTAETLEVFKSRLLDNPTVQDIYLNVK
ncbi:hypothetical protein MMC20_007532 [Loxospora ochrophaea]|nr:hypothetical protein [Loxospora ochrophaea]